jgi:hypothetical protein
MVLSDVIASVSSLQETGLRQKLFMIAILYCALQLQVSSFSLLEFQMLVIKKALFSVST